MMTDDGLDRRIRIYEAVRADYLAAGPALSDEDRGWCLDRLGQLARCVVRQCGIASDAESGAHWQAIEAIWEARLQAHQARMALLLRGAKLAACEAAIARLPEGLREHARDVEGVP